MVPFTYFKHKVLLIYYFISCFSDLKARARRWDEKQISTLMAKRDALQAELKEQLKRKRKEAELRTIQSQIKGLDTRLKYTLKDKDSTVSRVAPFRFSVIH